MWRLRRARRGRRRQRRDAGDQGGEGDGEADAQLEAAAARERAGLASVAQRAVIAHRFDADTLERIMAFTTAERTDKSVKELQDSPLLRAGQMPAPAETLALRQRRDGLRALTQRFVGLTHLGASLRDVATVQRHFAGKPGEVERLRPDDDVPPQDLGESPPSAPISGRPSDPVAYFAPSDLWRRPSDYVAHLATRFEEGPLNEETGRRVPRQLKRDQALFVAQFAEACNAVWDDEQNGVPMSRRKRSNLLLLGQGGSGKTAVAQ